MAGQSIQVLKGFISAKSPVYINRENMKIALDTLGCKLNQAETDILARQFIKTGHKLVSSVEEADIYVLNTCTVTHTADVKSRHFLRLAHRRNADAFLVAIGCYAQRVPRELTGIEGVSLVVDNTEKDNLLRLLEESGCLPKPALVQQGSVTGYETISRTRAFIKIQDGCSNYCSFCIVPLVRESETSLPANQVITDIRQRAAAGTREFVLTGTEIGTYSNNGVDLKSLLEKILNETEVDRIRLSSLQPGEISADLIAMWRNQRLCPHFHLSLQSGSDGTLKRMKRRYNTDEYQKAVSLIRATVPDAAITTDIITGFPGETEEEFEESYQFCRLIGFARIHIFPYSIRQGTEAAVMPEQIEKKIKKLRIQRLLALTRECAVNFNQRFSGKTMSVLWEQKSGGIWSGHTGNYIKVYTRNNDVLTGKLLSVKLGKAKKDGLWGECTGE
ncbi:tRNA (N(6)-L-threonylcarbamoyladenosine(37)-C(2))-methylthiotransferase MtaB [Chloroflexota bacterium]